MHPTVSGRWREDRLGLVTYVPMDAPRPEWLAYGEEVRSALTFEANLRAVVAMVRDRDEALVVMTFASYVPDDYSLPAFRERRLGYTLHLSPIEMWGTPGTSLSHRPSQRRRQTRRRG